jgi:hypothetical protein
MIQGKGKHKSRKGAFGRPWDPGEQASARITFESQVDTASPPEVEARLSRPQRDVLTTRQ